MEIVPTVRPTQPQRSKQALGQIVALPMMKPAHPIGQAPTPIIEQALSFHDLAPSNSQQVVASGPQDLIITPAVTPWS